MKRIIDLSTLVVLIAIVAGVMFRNGRGGAGDRHGAPLATINSDNGLPDSANSTSLVFREALYEAQQIGLHQGDSTAPVHIVVFADYGCGHCAEFAALATEVMRRLRAHVQVTNVAFPLTPAAGVRNMHLAAECANANGSFARFQAVAGSMPELAGIRSGWQTAFRRAGLPITPDLRRCVMTRRFASALQHQRELGLQMGVNSTPTIFVNEQRIVGTPPMADLLKIIAVELGRDSSPH